MKKYLPFLVGIAVVATTLVLAAEGYAKGPNWILYDNFNSVEIDNDLWTINSYSAEISVEKGRAKFAHKSGSEYRNISAWLGIKIAPETVKGIKVKVTVESCTGDVRARIGGFIGKVWDEVQFKYFWNQLGLEGGIGSPRIFGSLDINWPPPSFPNYYSLFYGQFMRPLEIIGHTFTIRMTFSGNKVTYEVDDLGEIEHKLPEDLSPTTDEIYKFKGIGTRSTNGEGPCVVYFDDVYILR